MAKRRQSAREKADRESDQELAQLEGTMRALGVLLRTAQSQLKSVKEKRAEQRYQEAQSATGKTPQETP